MREGHPGKLGSTPADGGVYFAVYSSVAKRVELCLFDEGGHETRQTFEHCDDDVWHGFVV